MKIIFLKQAEKTYRKLPQNIKIKADKQFKLIMRTPRHPSLRAKRMQGTSIFEARIDYHYRFTFEQEKDIIYIRTVGPHDVGLGKR